METLVPSARPLCVRCLRPARVCYCAHIPSLETHTRVVFLQHLRERRMPIGTARMAHLALPNSELHVGIEFEGDPRIEALAAAPGTFLLFPGDGAREVTELAPGELRTLIVVDGTWPLARKLIRVNPTVAALPKVRFTPERPGNYRIRREPAAHCLSTIEAVAEVLGRLEGDVDKFRRMLRAFDVMVDTQLALKAQRKGPSRYVKLRPKSKASQSDRVAEELRALLPRIVLVYGESNSTTLPDGTRTHEPIHLVAVRPFEGQRFEAVLAPSSTLDPSTPVHVELPEARLLAGEDREAALARLRGFVRGGDLLMSWGYFSWTLLKPYLPEGVTFTDLRDRLVRVLKRRPGSLDDAAALLGAPAAPAEDGRAGRRMRAQVAVFDALVNGKVAPARALSAAASG